jgi:hypothetical protein
VTTIRIRNGRSNDICDLVLGTNRENLDKAHSHVLGRVLMTHVYTLGTRM